MFSAANIRNTVATLKRVTFIENDTKYLNGRKKSANVSAGTLFDILDVLLSVSVPDKDYSVV